MKIIPLTPSLYYFLPINPKRDAFMLGGGGYYIGYYKDQSTQKESSFGARVGWGFHLRISGRIAIVGEGLYRFVSLI